MTPLARMQLTVGVPTKQDSALPWADGCSVSACINADVSWQKTAGQECTLGTFLKGAST